eukprot:6205986-Pleurochrysis_carterae.AAC.1
MEAAPKKPTPEGMAAETREASHDIGPSRKATACAQHTTLWAQRAGACLHGTACSPSASRSARHPARTCPRLGEKWQNSVVKAPRLKICLVADLVRAGGAFNKQSVKRLKCERAGLCSSA